MTATKKAVLDLVTAAMGSGIAWLLDNRDALIARGASPGENITDLLGGWPAEFLTIRQDLVEALDGDEHESAAPTEHTRVETDVWPMECIYGDCEHAREADLDAERPLAACPSSRAVVCKECSEQNAEYEGGTEPWPCQNQALQEWQAAGGRERQSDAMCEAFLRGWSEHETRSTS